MDSPVPLMHHDPDRSWITDPDPDHPKETHPSATDSNIFKSSQSNVRYKQRNPNLFVLMLTRPWCRLSINCQAQTVS